MFGSVPKNIWGKAIAADEENCIPLATRSLLITTKDRKILVDVGNGTKWSDKLIKIFAIKNIPLSDLPFTTAEITDIILTHLHFDHAGGISYKDNDEIKLTFPNAKIHIQKTNLDNALNPSLREAASYLKETVHPVRDGNTNQLTGPSTLFDGISVEIANGHTDGLQWLLIKDSQNTIAFPSDLIPTAHHVPIPYIMGYDICAATALAEKTAFLKRAHTENWIVIYEHDRDTACSRIGLDERGRYFASECQRD